MLLLTHALLLHGLFLAHNDPTIDGAVSFKDLFPPGRKDASSTGFVDTADDFSGAAGDEDEDDDMTKQLAALARLTVASKATEAPHGSPRAGKPARARSLSLSLSSARSLSLSLTLCMCVCVCV